MKNTPLKQVGEEVKVVIVGKALFDDETTVRATIVAAWEDNAGYGYYKVQLLERAKLAWRTIGKGTKRNVLACQIVA